jgi:hypothetical protein
MPTANEPPAIPTAERGHQKLRIGLSVGQQPGRHGAKAT